MVWNAHPDRMLACDGFYDIMYVAGMPGRVSEWTGMYSVDRKGD